MSAPACEITKDKGRYWTRVDGVEAEITFRQVGDVIDAYHTGVPRAIGGRGIAGALTRALLDDVRAEGLKLRPTCPYVDVWIKRHPEYEDLRA